MPLRRVLVAFTVAACVTGFLYTRSFAAINGIRVKLVQSPVQPSSGTFQVESGDLTPLADLHQPLALIARLHNGGDRNRAFAVSVDGGEAMCHPTLAPGESRRVDCVVDGFAAAGPHRVQISAEADAWTVDYLELATHFGNTSGSTYLVILPSASTGYVRPSFGFTALVVIGILGALILVSPTSLGRPSAIAHRALSFGLLLALLAMQISPWVSPYRVVLSSWSVVLWLGVVGGRHLWRLASWVVASRESVKLSTASFLRSGLVACGVLAVFWMPTRDALSAYGGNYSGFVMISERAFDANPLVRDRPDIKRTLILLDNGGYDGQFMYFAAFDPLMRAFRNDPRQYRDVVDAVPYRFGRIGFSLLTRLLALGQPERYPSTMVWLVLCSLTALAFCLATMAQSSGGSAALGGLVLLVPGFWPSIRSALPEPLAAAALVAALLFLRRQRVWPAGLLLAASLLVRETGVVLVCCLVGGLVLRGRRRDGLVLAATAIVPMVLWRLYVGSTIFPDWGYRGFLDHPADLTVPFRGLADLWHAIGAGQYAGGSAQMARAGITYTLLIGAAFIVSALLAFRSPSPITLAALCYASVAVSLNYDMIWVHVGNGQRGSYEVFVALAACTVAYRSYPRQCQIALAALWCGAAAYVLFGTYDAEFIRASISWPT